MAVGSAAALLVLTQLVFPGADGSGTPAAVLFNGLVAGTLNALLAAGLVLVYRSHRIINFAQEALGVIGGVLAYNLNALNGWPFPLAFVAGVLVAGVTGLAFELGIVRRFFTSPRLVLTVFTIALIPLIFVLVFQINLRLTIFPDVEDRTLEQVLGQALRLPFDGFSFGVGGFPLRFGFGHLFAIGTSLAALAGLAVFLRYTRMGIAVRASASNAERARLLGINVGTVSLVVWTIAGLMAGVGVLGHTASAGQFVAGAFSPELLFVALGAAVLARMQNLPLAAWGAVILSILVQAFEFSFAEQDSLVPALLLAAIMAGLLLQRRRAARSEEVEAGTWKATEEIRPIPPEMRALPGVRRLRLVLLGIALAGVGLWPWVTSTRLTNLGGYYAIVAIVLVSLTVLTGWAGQVSLGQFAFVAIGAVLGGGLTGRAGVSFWLALIVVPVLTAGITAAIGIPALRIRGLFLGVATFALAFAVQGALFREEYFGWILPESVDRPSLFLFDFEDERSMYYLSIASLGLVVVAVTALRRSRPGRILIGVRDNESNARSFGVNPVRMHLVAFAIAGFLCGFAGVLLAHHQRAVQEAGFEAELSLTVFLAAVLGGVGSVFGVLLGAVHFAAVDLIRDPNIVLFVGPFFIVAVLYVSPGGLAEIAMRLRDNVLRIVAQRRQMVVPSLFADYDPEALERKLAPLADSIPGTGVEAVEMLPGGRRYLRESELYGDRGRLVTTRRRRADEDAAAFGAAARSVAGDGEGAAAPPGDGAAEATRAERGGR